MGMLRRPSAGRPEKISMKQVYRLSVPGICPPGIAHVDTSAGGTDPDINTPDFPKQFRCGHPGEPCFETLVSLKRKNQLQVLTFHTVIQEAVIPYFLKP